MIQQFKSTTINDPHLFWILGWRVSPSTNHLATSSHLTTLAISWVLHRELWLSNSASQGLMANDLVPSFWTFIYLIQHYWCGVLSLPMAIYHTDCSFIIPLHLLSFVTWSSSSLTLRNILRSEISPPDTISSQNLIPKTTYPAHPGSALKLGSDTIL